LPPKPLPERTQFLATPLIPEPLTLYAALALIPHSLSHPFAPIAHLLPECPCTLAHPVSPFVAIVLIVDSHRRRRCRAETRRERRNKKESDSEQQFAFHNGALDWT
jgi:hypothetical protein